MADMRKMLAATLVLLSVACGQQEVAPTSWDRLSQEEKNVICTYLVTDVETAIEVIGALEAPNGTPEEVGAAYARYVENCTNMVEEFANATEDPA